MRYTTNLNEFNKILLKVMGRTTVPVLPHALMRYSFLEHLNFSFLSRMVVKC